MNTPIARARRLQPATRRNAIVWIALMAITIVWWQLTPEDHGSATASGKVLVSAIAALGMIKSRLIIRYFMEIRTAPDGYDLPPMAGSSSSGWASWE